MKTTHSNPLETPIQTPQNEEPSPSASSSSSASGEAVQNNLREAPDNPQPSTNNPQLPPPRANGRPSKLTPHLITAICHQITEFGNSDTAAAAHFGIPASTLSRWKFLNPDMELRFASSREDFRSRQIYKIENATTRDGRHDWRASAWLLERIFPQDYARRPGRRVNPASEEQTWLEESAAKHARKEEWHYQWEFETALKHGPAVARDYVTHAVWDLAEPNANAPLPVTASFDAQHKGPASLPSYATYAEALEQALHFDARKASIEFPLPTVKPAQSESDRDPRTDFPSARHSAVAPACSSPEGRDAAPSASQTSRRGHAAGGAEPAVASLGVSEITETAASPDARLPLHHHLHLPQETAALSAPASEITETPPPTAEAKTQPTSEISETLDSRRVAEGHTQASPALASVTSAEPGTKHPASRPEGTAQRLAHTEPASKITETSGPALPVFPVLTAFPFPAFSKSTSPAPALSQSSRNHAEPALTM